MAGSRRIPVSGGGWVEVYDRAPFVAARIAGSSPLFTARAALLVPRFRIAWSRHKSTRDRFDVESSVHLESGVAPYMSRYGVINDRRIVAQHPHILSIELGHEKVVPQRLGTGNNAQVVMVHTGEWVPGLHVMRHTAIQIGLFKGKRR